MPYAAKNYTHIQLIAYETPTLRSTLPGNPPPAPSRVPVPNLPDADSRARLSRFAGVLNYAANRLRFAGGDNASTLKVFIAPEFYFRPVNTFNAYTLNQMQNISAALRGMFADPAFADWLIVAGSIFSSLPADAKNNASTSRAYLNTACLIKGGHTEAPFFFVHKRLVSGIDGAPPNEAALLNPLFKPLLSDWDERKQNVFNLDNRVFGVEVCLDHLDNKYCRTLKNILGVWQGKEMVPPPAIDVHLLTSCGMEFCDRSSCARVNGYLLGVDGHPIPRNYGGHSQVERVTAQNLNGNATRSTNNVAGANMNTPLWSENIPDNLKTAFAPPAQPDTAYSQRVVCYPRQQL